MTDQPVIYMIAGANGAGKTTLAKVLLPDFLQMNRLINPDEIAKGLNPLDPPSMNRKAGELALRQMDEYIAEEKSFAFETTASGIAHAGRLKRAQEKGYQINLIYLFLTSHVAAQMRVFIRVQQGGHNVPADDIERRYYRGIHNILDVYLPLADNAYLYHGDNLLVPLLLKMPSEGYLFARKQHGKEFEIINPLMLAIMQQHKNWKDTA